MSDRPTPETDSQCYDCEYRGDMGGRFTADKGKLDLYGDHVPSDFARNLERERDEARELARELRDALGAVLPYIEGDRIAPWKPCVSALTKAKEVLG